MRPPGHCPAAELNHAHRDSAARPAVLESIEDQVSVDVSREVQTSKSDLIARGVAFDLLQVAERIGPQSKATDDEDLSGEENLTLDRIVADDRTSHQALW